MRCHLKSVLQWAWTLFATYIIISYMLEPARLHEKDQYKAEEKATGINEKKYDKIVNKIDSDIANENKTLDKNDKQLETKENVLKSVPNVAVVDTFDLRVMVLTGTRASSLRICLDSLNNATYEGDRILVEIWIDRTKNHSISKSVLQVAENFDFIHGNKLIHIHPKHVGIHKQWIDTWQPQENSTEIGLMLEDDIDVSKYFYRWLKKAYNLYGLRKDVAGIGLSTVMPDSIAAESVKGCGITKDKRLPKRCEPQVPLNSTIYMYRIATTWGFAPNPNSWRNFHNFYHKKKNDNKFKPIVPKIRQSTWFRWYGNTMWSIWHVYHMYKNKSYCVYPNLPKYLKFGNHRKEPGLHSTKGTHQSWLNTVYNTIVKTWNETYLDMPLEPAKVAYDGKIT